MSETPDEHFHKRGSGARPILNRPSRAPRPVDTGTKALRRGLAEHNSVRQHRAQTEVSTPSGQWKTISATGSPTVTPVPRMSIALERSNSVGSSTDHQGQQPIDQQHNQQTRGPHDSFAKSAPLIQTDFGPSQSTAEPASPLTSGSAPSAIGWNATVPSQLKGPPKRSMTSLAVLASPSAIVPEKGGSFFKPAVPQALARKMSTERDLLSSSAPLPAIPTPTSVNNNNNNNTNSNSKKREDSDSEFYQSYPKPKNYAQQQELKQKERMTLYSELGLNTIQSAIKEIIDSEGDYVLDLAVLRDVFWKPLQRLLSPDDMKTLFANLQSITLVHEEFNQQLQQVGYNEPAKFAELVLSFVPRFSIYEEYCVNHEQIPEAIKSIEGKNEKFVSFCKAAFNHPKCRFLPFTAFLITPVQRICKYPLLLQQAVKRTAETEPYYETLETALAKLSSIVLLINEKKRDLDSYRKLVQLSYLMSGAESLKLVNKTRKFLKQGILKKDAKGQKSQERMFFLFDDMIVYARVVKGAKKEDTYVFRGAISFDQYSTFNSLPSDELQFSLTRNSPEKIKMYTITCKSTQEKKEWVHVLGALFEERAKNAPTVPVHNTVFEWRMTKFERDVAEKRFNEVDVHKLKALTHEQIKHMYPEVNPQDMQHILALANYKKKGKLDKEEFAICSFLIHAVNLHSQKLPNSLPIGLRPKSYSIKSRLPKGWKEWESLDGRTFYYNTIRNQTTMEPPKD